MIVESILWTGIALGAAPIAGMLKGLILGRWPRMTPVLDAIGPWLYGLAPAYLALIRGAVLARPYGLYGRGGTLGWAIELIVGVVVLLVAWMERDRLGPLGTAPTREADILDEPRWALYRAAGILWVGSDTWGLLAGLGLGLLEWATRSRIWRAEARGAPRTCLYAFRLGLSTMLFALTGNVWITCLVQGGLWKIARREDGLPA
jgi:hypothetical protein